MAILSMPGLYEIVCISHDALIIPSIPIGLSITGVGPCNCHTFKFILKQNPGMYTIALFLLALLNC